MNIEVKSGPYYSRMEYEDGKVVYQAGVKVLCHSESTLVSIKSRGRLALAEVFGRGESLHLAQESLTVALQTIVDSAGHAEAAQDVTALGQSMSNPS